MWWKRRPLKEKTESLKHRDRIRPRNPFDRSNKMQTSVMDRLIRERDRKIDNTKRQRDK